MSVSTSPTAGSIWRGNRAAVLVGLLVVVGAVIGVLFTGGGTAGRYLDPDDTSLGGSRALADLLRDRGVEVTRVDSIATATALGAEGQRLLLVGDPSSLSAEEAGELAGTPGDRLVVGGAEHLDVLAPGVSREVGEVRVRSREPQCELPAARLAGSAFIGGTAFDAPDAAVGCYLVEESPTLVSYTAGRTITVVGSGDFMTNQRLAEDGNAALALNLLGGRPVTWLVEPAEGDTELAGPEGKSFGELMPASIPWAVLMAVVAVAVTALWRGRRLGPVVTERLPVVVRAAESVEGRGRLYRARRARDRAAGALRAGTLDRLTPRLGLGAGAAPDAIVSAIAVRTGQDPRQVGAALYGPAPADDAALVALAGYLDFVERQVSSL